MDIIYISIIEYFNFLFSNKHEKLLVTNPTRDF